MKRYLALFTTIIISISVAGQTMLKEELSTLSEDAYKTISYAKRDTCEMKMLVFTPEDNASSHPCVIYVYGGGFTENNLYSKFSLDYCERLKNDGFVAIAVDYRLGLKGFVSKGTLSMIKPTQNAIHIAAEDLLSATRYIIQHARELKIDPSRIITSGSSAGAVTVLQSDYELCNRTPITEGIPETFRYAGVMAFAGAVFSMEGQPKYKVHSPAPTLMMHGTSDVLVTYKSIQIFNMGLFGSSKLVNSFKKAKYPYFIARFKGQGHTVALYNSEQYEMAMWFIENMALSKKSYCIDMDIEDNGYAPQNWDMLKPDALYK